MSEVVEPIVEPKEEELVSKKVVEEYKTDLFKFKSKAKEMEAEVQRLKDEQALREKATLEEQAEWKTLYEREKNEKAKVLQDLQAKSEFFVNTSKINTVVSKLGGFKKDSYTKFIDTSKIDVREDGTFDIDSINREVDRIKQEYPELLSIGPSNGKMPSNAPSNLNITNTNDFAKMSKEDLLAQFSKAMKGQ